MFSKKDLEKELWLVKDRSLRGLFTEKMVLKCCFRLLSQGNLGKLKDA